MGKGKRTVKNKIFDPEKYGMGFCPDCKGKGKLTKKSGGFDVCSRCGGGRIIENGEGASEKGRK